MKKEVLKEAAFKNTKDSLARRLSEKVLELGEKAAEKKGRRIKIMEVCGTHTVAFSRSGLSSLLTQFVDLRSGPGCPICVTHQKELDTMISLAGMKDVIVATFGDLLKVPGSSTTLEKEKAKGAFVHLCYSPLEAVELALKYPSREVVFLGIGFETTAPAIAAALDEARQRGASNFSLYSALKAVPPALKALLEKGDFDLDVMVLPGHVSTVLGREAFAFVAREYRLPAVVVGFETLDLLTGLYYALKNVSEGKIEVSNAYTHVVREKGNQIARVVIEEHFEKEDASWRGLGVIPGSGYKLKRKFEDIDAKRRFELKEEHSLFTEPPGCRCGEIITGKLIPFDCPLFDRGCTPLTPAGPCMVSSEGACSAYYRYRLAY